MTARPTIPPFFSPSPFDLTRSVIRDIEVYAWEASTGALATRFGISPADVLRFDMNTSPFAPTSLDQTLAEVAIERKVNEYFDSGYGDLTDALARYNNVQSQNIVIGAGADEILDMIVKTFLDNGDSTIALAPTYPMYPILTEQMGGTVIRVPYGAAPDFSVSSAAILAAAAEHRAKIIFLCSPNNPTAQLIPLKILKEIIQQSPSMVVIDEAYFEFSGQTCAHLIEKFPHLVIVRTLSKAFAMAGGRVGYALAAPDTIALLNRVRPPNSVSYISATMAAHAVDHPGAMRLAVGTILNQRGTLAAGLENLDLGISVLPSDANFLLTRWPDAQTAAAIHARLLSRGIVLRRYPNHPLLENYLRITVRTAQENARLLNTLGS